MKKLKIAVYAICKNEEKHIKRWYESVKDADQIFILDTGSTDNSLDIIKSLNINYKQIIYKDFRFDTARNDCLDMIPSDFDICISIDLDEVIENGWRKIIEQNWDNNKTLIKYTYNWLIKDNKPQISFYANKIHTRKNYKWIYPVHEIIVNTNNNENVLFLPNLVINHFPDNTKSRKQYLKLLKKSVLENPENDRNMHYLGREYMYHKHYKSAIKYLKRHIKLKTATWKDEKAASMRFIARSYQKLNDEKNAIKWYKKSIKESPYLRDAYIELALLYFNKKEYNDVIYYVNKALTIKTHEKTYINETFSWNETPYDLLALAYYETNDLINSLKYASIALYYNQSSKRLKDNLFIIANKL